MVNDADLIRAKLDDGLERLLSTYFPGHVIRGGHAYLAPKGKADLGSWSVELRGAKRGQWFRFSEGVGGGSVELLSYHLYGRPDAYRETFREARAFLGMEGEVDEDAIRRARQRNDEARRRGEIEEAQHEEDTREAAARVWSEVVPLSGTLAEKYLIGFGLPVPPCGWPDCLGFHPALSYPGKGKLPALVARVDDFCGDLTGVWREYISADGRKAQVENQKLGLGPVAGGAVRIGGTGPKIGLAEGVRTAIGAWALIGFKYPVWSGLSTSGLIGFEVPLGTDRIVIYPDSDHPMKRQGDEYVPAVPAGRKAAQTLKARLIEQGVACTIAAEPAPSQDYLDIWNLHAREVA
jgi:hypothetical protein